MERRPTQLDHQWTLFALSSLVASFPSLATFIDLLGPLTYPCAIIWGHLKARVYEHKPRTLEELKEAICEEVAQIDKAMIEKVYANFQERLQKCITDNGHHMKDVIFHTLFCKMLFQYESRSVKKILFNKKLKIF